MELGCLESAGFLNLLVVVPLPLYGGSEPLEYASLVVVIRGLKTADRVDLVPGDLLVRCVSSSSPHL